MTTTIKCNTNHSDAERTDTPDGNEAALRAWEQRVCDAYGDGDSADRVTAVLREFAAAVTRAVREEAAGDVFKDSQVHRDLAEGQEDNPFEAETNEAIAMGLEALAKRIRALDGLPTIPEPGK